LHHIFHESQLKNHIGPKVAPNPKLPLLDDEDNILIAPEAIVEKKIDSMSSRQHKLQEIDVDPPSNGRGYANGLF
jgi:hypothetical protein